MPAGLDLAILVDAVIAFTLLEGAVLVVLHRRTGRGVAPRDFALNLLSGLCLMLALRAFATGAGAPAVALWLLGAGALHGLDLAWRWNRRAERTDRGGPLGDPLRRVDSARPALDLDPRREGATG